MIVRLKKNTTLTPREFSILFVNGGIPRCGPPRPDQLLPNRGDYSRSTREFIRPVGKWRSRRRRRTPRGGPRTFPPGTPPGGVPTGGVPGSPSEWAFLLGDPHLRSGRFWRAKFTPRGGPPVGAGIPTLGVHLRGGGKFRVRPGGSFRPRKQKDPLLWFRWWSRRGGSSTLGGAFPRPGGAVQVAHRRIRRHTLELTRVARLGEYRTGLFGRSRRKLKSHHPRRRWYLFRRRRLRGYVFTRVLPGNYFAGVTRKTFVPPRGNRFSWFEKMTTLGGPYLGAQLRWTTWTFGGRISTPLEYNHYTRTGRFFRLVKRGRTTGRRWKLGQHPRWAAPFREVRAFRWGWFRGTPLGGLLEATPTPEVPHTRGLAGGVYWSTHRWGRSRWDRPAGRGAHSFVESVKTTPGVESDATQWGGAATSGTGVLLGLEPQWTLRGTPGVHGTPRGVLRGRRLPRRWWLRAGWALVTPVWRVYAAVAGGWAWLFEVTWVAIHTVVTLVRVVLVGVSRFVKLLVRGVTHAVSYHVRENPLTRAAAWGITSWSLVYASDNDRPELANPTYDYEEPNDTYFTYELDHPQENHTDFDQLGEGIWSDFPQKNPFKSNWTNNDLDDFVAPVVELFARGVREVLYWVGFTVRVVVDGVVRFPGWTALEGVSLVALGVKLELQRRWLQFLRTSPVVGVLLRRLVGWAFFAVAVGVVGSQLDYPGLRVFVVYSLGVPWREEYYLGWWFLTTVGVARVVAPAGVKDFLFRQVGFSNLAGLLVGSVESAHPEEYQPGRPGGVVFRNFTNFGSRTKGGPGKWARGESGEDRTAGMGRINPGGFDAARVVLAWESSLDGEPLYDPLYDYENYWMVYPLHVGSNTEVNRLHPFPVRDPSVQLVREPHRSGNRYDLDWTHRGEIGIPQFLPPYGLFPSPRDGKTSTGSTLQE